MKQDPVTELALELSRGYHPSFNIRALETLIEQAWQMGMSVVRDEHGPLRFQQALLWRAHQMSNAAPDQTATDGLRNAVQP